MRQTVDPDTGVNDDRRVEKGCLIDSIWEQHEATKNESGLRTIGWSGTEKISVFCARNKLTQQSTSTLSSPLKKKTQGEEVRGA